MDAAAGAFDLTQRLPTTEEIESAAVAASALASTRQPHGALTVTAVDGETVTLAPALADLVLNLLGHVADGQMVTVVPVGAMLTTQQAADMLNVSRPHLSKMLKEGKIPFTPVGSHRRVCLGDLMAYKKRRDAGRREALRELARLGQEYDAG